MNRPYGLRWRRGFDKLNPNGWSMERGGEKNAATPDRSP